VSRSDARFSKADIQPLLHLAQTVRTVVEVAGASHTRGSIPARSKVKVVSSSEGNSDASQSGQMCSRVSGAPPQKMHFRATRQPHHMPPKTPRQLEREFKRRNKDRPADGTSITAEGMKVDKPSL
jgi:hypothetical protein